MLDSVGRRIAVAALLVAACTPPVDTGDTGSIDVGPPDAGLDANRPADAARIDAAQGDAAGPCAMPDQDHDGHNAITCAGDDCDDHDANRFPGNPEVCDTMGHDEDCNPLTFGTTDTDGDHYISNVCYNTDAMGVRHGGDDCDDLNRNVNPGQAEVCNSIDDDCDTVIDEGVLVTYYADCDGDGFGAGAPMMLCTPTLCMGHAAVTPNGDCDDTNRFVHPGGTCDCAFHAYDMDADLHYAIACGGDDCVDTNAAFHPGALGTCGICPMTTTQPSMGPELCNLLDDDCDGLVDEGADAACMLAGATSACRTGACTIISCLAPAADCDGLAANGCEVNLSADPRHCGACTTSCVTGAGCRASVCRPLHVWSTSGGGPRSDFLNDMAVGGGIACAVGSFTAPASFGGATFASGYAFVACWNAATGAPVWSRALSATANAVVVDSTGSAYVGGGFNVAVDFGGGVRTPASVDGYIARYSATGAYLADRVITGSSNEVVAGLGVDATDRVYATGSFSSTDTNFGSGTRATAGMADVFAVAYAAIAMPPLWVTTFGGAASETGVDIAGDGPSVSLTGTFGAGINPGGGPMVGAGLLDVFVVGLAGSDGTYRWQRRIGGTGNDYVSHIAAAAGVVAVGVSVANGATLSGTFPAVNYAQVGMADGIVVAYAADGTYRFSHVLGSTENDSYDGVAIDPSGGVIATGYYEGSVDLGGGVFTAVGLSDIAFASWDATGVYRWSRSFGGPGYDGGWAVAAPSDVWLAGNFAISVGLGGATLVETGGTLATSEIFVARFTP